MANKEVSFESAGLQPLEFDTAGIEQEIAEDSLSSISQWFWDLAVTISEPHSFSAYLEDGWKRIAVIPGGCVMEDKRNVPSYRVIVNQHSTDRAGNYGTAVEEFLLCLETGRLLYVPSDRLEQTLHPDGRTEWEVSSTSGPMIFMRNSKMEIHLGKEYEKEKYLGQPLIRNSIHLSTLWRHLQDVTDVWRDDIGDHSLQLH